LRSAAVGGGILAVGALAAGVASEEAGLLFGAALLYTGVGAGVGAGIDALVEGRRVIYASSNSARIKLTVAPVLSGPGKGVLVSLRLTR
jgi:hypothetical protein